MIEIKNLSSGDITNNMLSGFNHYQIISKKWVNRNNSWFLSEADDIRQWSEEKRIWITEYLRQQLERGGSVAAAFENNIIVGFCCVDGYLCGEFSKYANMTMLFVDDKFQRKGIDKKLFAEICRCAAKMKADKLFISAIPSFETVAFYFSLGCLDAEEIISDYIDTENDRYLEFPLNKT